MRYIDSFPNACSVTLRVFVELSIDHYLTQKNIMPEKERRSTPLAKRLKSAVGHLAANGKINEQLKEAINKVADSDHFLAASMMTFNLYVHNQYAFPKPSELRTAWIELQPLMEKLWP